MISEIDKPNLFSFATSELSQDAFFCWLLSWAKPELSKENERLHACAVAFIEAFAGKHGIKIGGTIDTVDVKRQYRNIDILVLFHSAGKDYALVIEDKIHTKDHSNQLDRYKGIVKKEFGEREQILIYLKTGDEMEQKNYKEFKPFWRKDILDILCEYKGCHSILDDFFKVWKNWDNSIESYKTTPVVDVNGKASWSNAHWTGFFKKLSQYFDGCGWHFVNNPSGGFMAFYWNRHDSPIDQNTYLFMQIRRHDLCFRIGLCDSSNKKLDQPLKKLMKEQRDLWLEKFQEIPSEMITVVKPARYGTGKTITFAIVENGFRAVGADQILDFDHTVKVIKEALRIQEEALKKAEEVLDRPLIKSA